MLKVVDPALRDRRIVRSVDPGRDRADALGVVVGAGRGRAIGIRGVRAATEVVAADLGLDEAEGRRGARGRRGRRGRIPRGGAGIGRCRCRGEHEDRDEHDAGDRRKPDQRGPVALEEGRLVGGSLPIATALARSARRGTTPRGGTGRAGSRATAPLAALLPPVVSPSVRAWPVGRRDPTVGPSMLACRAAGAGDSICSRHRLGVGGRVRGSW